MKNIPPDIEIAQASRPKQITEIAKTLGLRPDEIEPYGSYKAKISLKALERLGSRPDGKLINVTAITPTNAGEGKTCTAIGLAQAFGKLKKKVCLCLREPSLGPVFGIKGGAAGGGYSQVIPMDDVNLHFTGDIHAVGAAHNLLAAMTDNHVIKGNELGIDLEQIVIKRVMDISDRQLRHIRVGLSGAERMERDSGFIITVASEVMAILALTNGIEDLKNRLGRIVVAYTKDGKPITAKDIKAVGAMALLLKDAIKPNLIQTLEGQPVIVHAGPFANIAHGNNSVLATKLALKLSGYVITESGFGADLGTEKFFDIVCRQENLKPDAVVLVVSIRALKIHGGLETADMEKEDAKAVERGLANLEKHVENIKKFGIFPIVAVNRFYSDTDKEIQLIKMRSEALGVRCEISEVVGRGGEGGLELANAVMQSIQEHPPRFKPLYPLDKTIKEKIEIIAKEIYGADGVNYSGQAKQDIERLERLGFGKLPINMAKTQLSISDDPKKKGAPAGWRLTVREVYVSAGAGFVVAVTGSMMLMPGLPKSPAAERMDIDGEGRITGLF